MYPLKDPKIISSRVHNINKDLIEFDKECGSFFFFPPDPIDRMLSSKSDLLCHGKQVPYNTSIASDSTSGAEILRCNIPNEISSASSLNSLPKVGICLGSSIFKHEVKKKKCSEDKIANPIKNKIQRRDASEDLSPYFR